MILELNWFSIIQLIQYNSDASLAVSAAERSLQMLQRLSLLAALVKWSHAVSKSPHNHLRDVLNSRITENHHCEVMKSMFSSFALNIDFKHKYSCLENNLFSLFFLWRHTSLDFAITESAFWSIIDCVKLWKAKCHILVYVAPLDSGDCRHWSWAFAFSFRFLILQTDLIQWNKASVCERCRCTGGWKFSCSVLYLLL